MAAALTSAFRLGTGPASERMLAAAVDANGGLLGVASFHDTWARTQDALVQELAATTLAQIAAIDAAIEAGSHHPETPPHSRPTDRYGNRN